MSRAELPSLGLRADSTSLMARCLAAPRSRPTLSARALGPRSRSVSSRSALFAALPASLSHDKPRRRSLFECIPDGFERLLDGTSQLFGHFDDNAAVERKPKSHELDVARQISLNIGQGAFE